jgi:hypothetical protein
VAAHALSAAIGGEMAEAPMGMQMRLISPASHRLTGLMSRESRTGQGREHAEQDLAGHPDSATVTEPSLRQARGLTPMRAEPPEGADRQGERWDHEGEEA